jgi:antitoxin component of RelBE/YafQ-DinJ toxin-antitoxin module
MKEPLNLSIEGRVIKEFKKNVERVGLSVSGVIEVFMRGMISDEPLERMKRFIDLTTIIRKESTR